MIEKLPNKEGKRCFSMPPSDSEMLVLFIMTLEKGGNRLRTVSFSVYLTTFSVLLHVPTLANPRRYSFTHFFIRWRQRRKQLDDANCSTPSFQTEQHRVKHAVLTLPCLVIEGCVIQGGYSIIIVLISTPFSKWSFTKPAGFCLVSRWWERCPATPLLRKPTTQNQYHCFKRQRWELTTRGETSTSLRGGSILALQQRYGKELPYL